MCEELPATQKLFLKCDVGAVVLFSLQERALVSTCVLCHGAMARSVPFHRGLIQTHLWLSPTAAKSNLSLKYNVFS